MIGVTLFGEGLGATGPLEVLVTIRQARSP